MNFLQERGFEIQIYVRMFNLSPLRKVYFLVEWLVRRVVRL